MKSLYDRYVESCMKVLSPYECVDPKKLRIHNTAATWRHKTHEKMMLEEDRCLPLAAELLAHPDERVRLAISAYCLEAEILVDQALEALHYISTHAKDPFMQFDAECTIKYCNKSDPEAYARRFEVTPAQHEESLRKVAELKAYLQEQEDKAREAMQEK